MAVPDLQNVVAKLKRARYSVASEGLFRVAMDVAARLVTYAPDKDGAFDRRFGTDTAGKVQTSALGFDDGAAQDKAVLYLPSPAKVTHWMLENIGLEPRNHAFVDLGCGKGRVVLVAAQYPFAKVIGVDLSKALSEVARRNVARFDPRSRKCADVQIVTANATTFDWPDANVLLHLYHPFEPEITVAVLEHAARTWRARAKQLTVAYLLYSSAVPAVREAFARFPWLVEKRYEHSLFGNYDWLFFQSE